jgi:hypothetical protein
MSQALLKLSTMRPRESSERPAAGAEMGNVRLPVYMAEESITCPGIYRETRCDPQS